VESPLRCKAHGGFGERPGETDWQQRQHRAPGRLNPHQGIANARPSTPLAPLITDPDQIARLDVRRHQRLGGILDKYRHAT